MSIIAKKAKISAKDERLLHTKSGNRCANCSIILVEDSVCIGENAHIFGEKLTAARHDSTIDTNFVNSEKNLIFLCRNCHKTVDSDEQKYTAEILFSMKEEHEKGVIQALQQGSIDYTFVELHSITNYLVQESGRANKEVNYKLLRLPDKISKNQLADVQGYIDIGLISVSRIEDYLNRHPDPSFADKLTEIIVNKYSEFKKDGLDPISIFNALWDFASNAQIDYNYRSAGLAVLVYFFEKCEVFEK